MEPKILYKSLLKSIGKELKAYSFKKNGAQFIQETDAGYNIVHFQVDKYASKEEYRFTVEIGVAPKKLFEVGALDLIGKVDIADCLFRTRLNHLMGRREQWWRLETKDSVEQCFRDIWSGLQDKALPIFTKTATESELVLTMREFIGGSDNARDLRLLIALLHSQSIDFSQELRTLESLTRLNTSWTREKHEAFVQDLGIITN